MKLRVDPEQLTLGDVEDIEEAGFALSDLGGMISSGRVPAKLGVVLVWILRRMEDPTFTYEDARAQKITELEIELVEVADSPKGGPTDGGSLRSVSPPAGSRNRSVG